MVPIKRVPGALWAAMRHNILPGEYCAYALWQPRRRKGIDNYLYSHEAPRLFKIFNRPLQPDPIGDKLAFHDMCQAHGFPTPAVLAAYAPTGKLRNFEFGQPPEQDLFVKRRVGTAGLGAERLRWRGDTFESNRGPRIKPQELDDYLANRAKNETRTLMVQPVLTNHPDLRARKDAALATARLVTGRSGKGDIVPIFAFIYFGLPTGITAQHGPVALLDVVSGRLIWPPRHRAQLAEAPNDQPDYGPGGIIVLPDWNAAVQLAKDAHRACANFAFVGWDVALTDNGPSLLEGNGNWTADEYQSLSGEPLGQTKFTEVLESRLLECQEVPQSKY
jgi:hypothetical protein